MHRLTRLALEAIVSSIPAGVVVVEKEGGKIVYVNDRAITLYGCDPSGLDLLNYSTRMMRLLTLDGQIYSPEQLPVSKALSTGQEVKDELIIERPDKSRITVAASAKPVKDEKGQIVAAVGIFEDITDYKNAEGILRANEQRWTTTLASIGDAVIATDEKGNITFMNKVAEKLTGYSFQEAMQKSLKEVFHIVNEHNGQEVISPVDRVFREGAAVALVNHTMLIRKDGAQVPIADSGAPIKDSSGKTTGVVLVFHDMSDRRLAEKTLKQSEERYRTLFSNMDEAFALHEMIFDSQGIPVDYRFLEVNEAFERLTGFKESQIVGKTAREVMPSVEPFWIETYGKVVTTGEPVRFERYDQNTNKHYEVHAFRPVEGRCAALFNDITERKQLQQRLEDYTKNLERVVKERTTQVSKERKRLFDMLEALPAYVVLLDKDYYVLFANKIFRERFGESRGRRCYDFLFNRKVPCEDCKTYKVLKNNNPNHWEWDGPDGRSYEVYDFPFVEADGSTFILEMGIDITERKRAEKEAVESAKKLKDAERLAAIGQTAGMVGHDLRNPLQSIIGEVYLAESELKLLPEGEHKICLQESIQAIAEQIGYMDKIVSDLQVFVRPVDVQKQKVELKRLIEATLAQTHIPQNVQASLYTEETLTIQTDPYLLKRVLINLITNAVQAMPEGGKLTIQAHTTQTGYVQITVEDTGTGIPEEIKPKLFTPLFTTKSKGQGFGLAACKRVMEAQNGTISFESEVNKGTKFIVELPIK